MKVEPYLIFNGRCDEAIAFYKHAIGANVTMLLRFKDAPPGVPTDPAAADRVMHASLTVGDGQVMCCDGMDTAAPRFEGVMLSLRLTSDAEAHRTFTTLADGGQITVPIGKSFFATSFGMLTDRFGVSWMVMTGG